MIRIVGATGARTSLQKNQSSILWQAGQNRVECTATSESEHMLSRLIHHRGAWVNSAEANLEEINNTYLSLIPEAFSGQPSEQAANIHRAIVRSVLADTAEQYNQSRKLYQAARAKGYHRLPFMNHALPLDEATFPHGWRLTAPQAYVRDLNKKDAPVLVCFTGKSGLMDMPIPYFHAWAHRIFNAVVYLYDPTKNRYKESREGIIQAIRQLLNLLGSSKLHFAGVSYGASTALWCHGRMDESRGVLGTSPLVHIDDELSATILQNGHHALRGSHLFFSAENRLDNKSYNLLYEQLPAELFVKHVFNIGWASPSHGSMGTLMAMGCLGMQLLWLRHQPSESEPSLQLA